MHPLYQRLRELDWDTFQRFAEQLLSEKHPGLSIKHVEGSGGDKGLDLFEGALSGGSTIWQCKHFPNGLRAKQRPQVLKSLNDAIDNFKPERWILVLSIDFDTSAHEWFQKVQAEFAARTSIGQFLASDIVRELIHRRKLRDAFFPGAVLDTIAVRRSQEGLGTADQTALDDLSAKNLDEQIARLEEFDARFDYRISYAPNGGADIANATPQGPLHIASIMNGAKRTDIFVRDPEAVRLDPPKVKFSVSRSGLEKIQEFCRTGKVQRLLPGEVNVPRAAFDFALPTDQPTNWQLVLMPSASITGQTLSWRVTVSDGTEEVRYDLIKFRIVAPGNEQVEIESISSLPFVLGLTVRTQGKPGGNFTFTERFKNHKLSEVAKALRLKHLLARGAGIELYSLDQDLPIGVFSKGENLPSEISGPDRAHLDMAEVASVFGWDVPFPEKIDEEDLNQLAFLVLLVRDLPLPVEVLSGVMQKSPQNVLMVREHENSDFEVFACYDSLFTPMIFCGTEVRTGRLLLHSLRGRIVDAADLLRRLEAAADGEPVPVQFNVGVVHGYRAPEWKSGCMSNRSPPRGKHRPIQVKRARSAQNESGMAQGVCSRCSRRDKAASAARTLPENELNLFKLATDLVPNANWVSIQTGA